MNDFLLVSYSSLIFLLVSYSSLISVFHCFIHYAAISTFVSSQYHCTKSLDRPCPHFNPGWFFWKSNHLFLGSAILRHVLVWILFEKFCSQTNRYIQTHRSITINSVSKAWARFNNIFFCFYLIYRKDDMYVKHQLELAAQKLRRLKNRLEEEDEQLAPPATEDEDILTEDQIKAK